MKLRLMPRAEDDLAGIVDYIAADNPGRADSFSDEILERCAAIADAPRACMQRPDLGRDLRCCPHGNYLIFYRVDAHEVQIVRVLHAARDLQDLARHGNLNEPRAPYAVSPFEALGFLRVA